MSEPEFLPSFMVWPAPEFVLYVLGAFLVAYGIALSFRASRARRWAGDRVTCPECNKPWRVPDALACAHCGVTPPAPSAIRAALLWVVLGSLLSIAGVGAFLGGLQLAAWLEAERSVYGPASGAFAVGPILGGGLGLSVFGVYLGVIAYRGQRSNGRRRCPTCWYLIDAALGLKCSECGHEAKREKDLYRPRRRYTLVALGVLLVALGQLGWVETRVRRGGWLAAVPTEVLILGMPWLPDYCLSNGLSGVDEDWSLTGRFTDARYSGEAGESSWRVWSWHRPWAASRADSRLLSATTLADAVAAIEVLVEIGSDEQMYTLPPRHAPALIHAARLAVPQLNGPNSAGAAVILRHVGSSAWESRGDDQPAVPHPGISEFVAESQDQLTPCLTGPVGWETISATTLLAMGNGEPEVVSALLDAVPSNRWALGAVTNLSRRLPHVAESLERTIRDPDNPRRGYAAAAAWLRLDDGSVSDSLVAALTERTHDPDPSVVLAASTSLWQSRDHTLQCAGFDGLLRAYKADSLLGSRVVDLLSYRLYHVMPHAVPGLLELARTDDPEHHQFFLALVLSEPHDMDPLLAGEAIRLIDAGAEVPDGFESDSINTLRARGVRSDSAPDATPQSAPDAPPGP